MNRRDFLQLLGASAILGIVGGCARDQSASATGRKAGEVDILSGGPFSNDYDSGDTLARNEVYLAPRDRTGSVPGESRAQAQTAAGGKSVTA